MTKAFEWMAQMRRNIHRPYLSAPNLPKFVLDGRDEHGPWCSFMTVPRVYAILRKAFFILVRSLSCPSFKSCCSAQEARRDPSSSLSLLGSRLSEGLEGNPNSENSPSISAHPKKDTWQESPGTEVCP